MIENTTPNENNTQLPYYLAFARYPKLGAVSIAKIHAYFGDMKIAWHASKEDFLNTGIRKNVISEFIATRNQISPQQELDLLKQHNTSAITAQDDAYPAMLRQIYDPPAILFYKGRIPNNNENLLAIVGSRRATPYAKRVLEKLIPDLVASGVSIVSGLALGVDGLAHHHSVESNGLTYAVLAGGVNHESVSPSRHKALASRIIASGGGLLSEFSIGTESFKSHFPYRNRIISGMCRATLIVEATERSGSLITARSAMEQNRDVMVIPGPIDSALSSGPNRLLREGAHPITKATDVLEIFEIEPKSTKPIIVEPQNADEATILPLLKNVIHVDDIVKASGLPAPLVLQTITSLELRDCIKHIGGNRYCIRN